MKQSFIINGILTEIEIKQPNVKNINELVVLNKKWQLTSLNGNTKQGFLSGAFDEIFFKELITNEAIIVAYCSNQIIAYMLTANHSNIGLLQTHKDKVVQLKNNGIINNNINVAVGIQTVVEAEYHGTGLIAIIRNEFRNMLKNRFQLLFTTIAKNNQRSFASATKYGWKTVEEDEHHYHLILNV